MYCCTGLPLLLLVLLHHYIIFAEEIDFYQYQESSINDLSEKVVNIRKESFQFLQRTKRDSSSNYSAQPTKLPVNNSMIVSNHTYYTSSFVNNLSNHSKYFIDLKSMKESNNSAVKLTSFKARTPGAIEFFIENLNFVFPFYGHDVSRVVVTSAGFLHVGQIIHNMATDVHYIAPLMANFTPIANRTTDVYTYNDGFRFTAQWDSVYEADKNASNESFTFQVSLFKDGTIFFSYRNIPYNISKLASKRLKPKVGLADGFIYTFYIRIMNRRIGPYRLLSKYHTVELPKNDIGPNSAFILTPVPNCISAKNCNTCFSKEIAANFKCKWCSELQLCSDTFDWHRQRWIINGCPRNAIASKDQCNAMRGTTPYPKSSTTPKSKFDKQKTGKPKANFAAIFISLLVVVIVLIIAVICVYGYRNPASKIGMFMIEHRPAKLFGRI